MQITILTVGSQGDVQPYVALGAGLRAAGYDVTLVTSVRFAGFVTAAGLQHTPVRADFLQFLVLLGSLWLWPPEAVLAPGPPALALLATLLMLGLVWEIRSMFFALVGAERQ
jgi:hypothetical protein